MAFTSTPVSARITTMPIASKRIVRPSRAHPARRSGFARTVGTSWKWLYAPSAAISANATTLASTSWP